MFSLTADGIGQVSPDYSVCTDMVQTAAHNVGLTTSSYEYLSTVFDNYCERNGTTRKSALDTGMSTIVKAIPVQFTLGASDEATAMTNYCRTYSSITHEQGSTFASSSQVVEEALISANDCVKAVQGGNAMSHQIINPKMLIINIKAGSGQRVTIGGVAHDPKVTCQGHSDGIFGTKTFEISTSYEVTGWAGSYNITCTRMPSGTSNGMTTYDDAAISVSTNIGPYNVYWPKETLFPMNAASDIQKALASLACLGCIEASVLPDDQFQKVNGAEWVLCKGQDIKGSRLSQFTGQTTVPDLRGVFLRGKRNNREIKDVLEIELGTYSPDTVGAHTHTYVVAGGDSPVAGIQWGGQQ